MMFVAKACLVGSSVGLVTLAQIAPTIENGKKFSELGALGIMGTCLLACVAAIVILYRDKEKDRTKIETLLERCAIAMEAVKTSADANTIVMVEVKDVIHKCKGH
jgi:hypothetical protein